LVGSHTAILLAPANGMDGSPSHPSG
jgi:hypothetical protein